MAITGANDRHCKNADADILATEAEKSRLAAEIGKRTGLFYVPEILRYQPQEGILEFEWLEGLESLTGVALARDPQMTDLCRRAGAALCAIHKQLRLPQRLKIPLPEPASSAPDSDVFFHGDFNGDNVCYDRTRDRLVIVDWSSAPLFGGKPTFGSRYFDVLWFGHFFFCSRPARWFGKWQDLAWYEALIRGYTAEVGSPFPEPEFGAYRLAAEPVFSAARKQMLASTHGFRRIVRAVVLWRAKVRWRRMDLNSRQVMTASSGCGLQPITVRS